MSMSEVVETLAQVPKLAKLARVARPRPLSVRDSLGARVEDTARRFGDRTAVVFEGQTVTWGELNARANRYAGALRELGLVRGDVASLMMENRIQFLAVVIGLAKLGVTSALINTSLAARPLAHCISITGSKLCIFGEERAGVIGEVRPELDLPEGEGFVQVADAGEAPPRTGPATSTSWPETPAATTRRRRGR